MALPLSTANWHWKNKNATRWGEDWFQRELTTITITGDSEAEHVSVSRVTTVEGDIELGQRKSKYALDSSFDILISSDHVGTHPDSSPYTTVELTWSGPELPAMAQRSKESSPYPKSRMRSLSMVCLSIP